MKNFIIGALTGGSVMLYLCYKPYKKSCAIANKMRAQLAMAAKEIQKVENEYKKLTVDYEELASKYNILALFAEVK